MITGLHAIIYSSDPQADRAFFRDVLGFPYVDTGDGWLIFRAPPTELAVHPAEPGGSHEVYLMCDDIHEFVASTATRGVACSVVSDQGWGLLSTLTLPGGGRIGIYEPRHEQPVVE